MLEVLQFIFSSFWIWLGTAVLVGFCASYLAIATAAVLSRRS